jgi:uncharacterized integral membrane protein
MNVRQVLGWVLVALLVLFVAFNLDDARVWFFGIRLQMPIALVVIVSAALGAASTLLFGRLWRKQT